MVIHIASVAYLRHVVGGTSEGLRTFDLATRLLVAFVGLFDEGFGNQRLAATAHCFVSPFELKLLDAKEVARGRPVGAQASFRFQLLLHILDPRFRAVVFMVGAMVVADIVCEFSFPTVRILKLVL